jgi:dolichol kinase
LFALCWPLYPIASPWSRFFAAAVPLLASIKFALVAKKKVPDILGLVPGITRTGQRKELLQGPFIYGIVHAAITIVCWRQPAAILAIATLCGSDGLAEVAGTSIASPQKLPWNRNKSVAGSVACFVGSAVLGTVLLNHFISSSNGLLISQKLAASLSVDLLPKVALCSVIATLVESLPLPYEGGDNITVPISALIASRAILGA